MRMIILQNSFYIPLSICSAKRCKIEISFHILLPLSLKINHLLTQNHNKDKTKTQHGQVIFSLQCWMLGFLVHSPRSIQERETF